MDQIESDEIQADGLDDWEYPDTSQPVSSNYDALLEQAKGLHKRQDSMDCMVITPTMAEKFLALNKSNRRLKNKLVSRIAADIKQGLWSRNGDSIRFDTNGNLLDGQHRLYALVRAAETNPDATITTYIVTGLDPSVADTIDTGAARTLGDTLKIRGFHGNSHLASTINTAFMWANGTLQDGRKIAPTKTEVIHTGGFLDSNPWVSEYVEKVEFITKCEDFKYPIGPAAVLCHEFDMVDEAKSTEFWRILTTGADSNLRIIPDQNHAVIYLRNKLRKELPRRGSGAKMYHTELMALTIKAWNAYCADEQVKVLSFKQSGKTRETFPTIIGS